MNPDIVQAWVHDVTQSRALDTKPNRKRKRAVFADMDTNAPLRRRSPRKQTDSKRDRSQGGDVSDLAVGVKKKPVRGKGQKRDRNEDADEAIPADDPFAAGDPHATPRAKTYSHALRDDNASPTRLSLRPISTSSQSSQSTRSTSPVKRTQDLRKLQKPVRFANQNPRDLAATIASVNAQSLQLFRRINTKVTSQRGILPLELRDELLPELGYGLEDGDDEDIAHLFSTRTTRPTAATSRKALKDRRRQRVIAKGDYDDDGAEGQPKNQSPQDDILHHLNLLDEFETLLDIVARTSQFKAAPNSEAAWNEEIHSCILRLAMGDWPGVRVENVTRANIAKPFHPLARPELELEVPLATKMIDYALLLQPELTDPLSGAIQDFVAKLRYQTFNQSMYEHLRTGPSGVFIETKVETKRYAEARTQLGLWLATWYDRVREFHSTDSLVLPVLIATAEAWELWFAIDRCDYFDICGPLSIGGTDNLQSIYLLRYCLSCLGEWMTTDFRSWVKLCIGME